MGRHSGHEGDAVESEEYYHGLLPREDLPYLLHDPGDFLVRTSEVHQGHTGRQHILSVCTARGTCMENREIKHVVIKKLPNGKHCFDDRCSFRTVGDLIAAFLGRRESVFVGLDVIITSPVRRQRWELRHDDIHLMRKLGEGAYGEVHAGKLKTRSSTYDVAVKLAKTSEMTKEKIKEMMKEARIMRNFDHPNVVRLYGVCVEREPLLIVMEFVNGGSLDSYITKNKGNISCNEKLINMVYGAALGLEYLHENKCIHRDIAARNCLYHDGRTLKISDFGLSREGDQYVLKRICSVPIKWLAPETIQSLVYTAKTDVWSFGVLCFEVYAGQEPYAWMNNAEVKEKVTAGYRLPFPEDTPLPVVQMVNASCWAANPEERWNMGMVVRQLQGIMGPLTPPPHPREARTPSSNISEGNSYEKCKKKKPKSRR